METFAVINSKEIILTDNKSKYETGDRINGKLVISLKGELIPSAIKISLICLAEVDWTESRGVKTVPRTFHLKRKYLDQTYQLPEEIRGRSFKDGLNEIPFTFQLPQNEIPSSFTGSYGSVSYFIEANVDPIAEPIVDESEKTVKQIIVEAPFRENLLLSVDGSTDKEISIMFGAGDVFLHATIPKKGHAPGETLEVDCTIDNGSTARVTPRVVLYQTQIFMTGERHKTIETLLTEPSFGKPVGAEVTAEDAISLLIPENIPLSIKSTLITVKYFIRVILDIPNSMDLQLNLPIVITNRHALNNVS